jgi:hypothetical protein
MATSDVKRQMDSALQDGTLRFGVKTRTPILA